MKFEEIFNKPGLYKADSFQKGVAFEVTDDRFLNMVTYKDKSDFLPTKESPLIYKGLFDKEFVKVFTIKQLFENGKSE